MGHGNLVREVRVVDGRRIRRVLRWVLGRVQHVRAGRRDARSRLVPRAERLGLVRVGAEALLELLEVVGDARHLAPDRARRLARVGERLLADDDQAVELLAFGREDEVELGHVVERLGVLDLDLGAEHKVAEALLDDAYTGKRSQ